MSFGWCDGSRGWVATRGAVRFVVWDAETGGGGFALAYLEGMAEDAPQLRGQAHARTREAALEIAWLRLSTHVERVLAEAHRVALQAERAHAELERTWISQVTPMVAASCCDDEAENSLQRRGVTSEPSR